MVVCLVSTLCVIRILNVTLQWLFLLSQTKECEVWGAYSICFNYRPTFRFLYINYNIYTIIMATLLYGNCNLMPNKQKYIIILTMYVHIILFS